MIFKQRDHPVALETFASSIVPDPLAMGAFRSFDLRESWLEETEMALAAGKRVVLSGHISNFEELAQQAHLLLVKDPDRRMALMIHWAQARQLQPRAGDVNVFESIYIVVDEHLSNESVSLLRHRWSPKWVLLPRAGLSWKKLTEELFGFQHRGDLIVLCPSHDSQVFENEYLSPDELALQLEELNLEHPLIKTHPAPHEWYVPIEIGPWRSQRRSTEKISVLKKTSSNESKASVIIPFFWNGETRRLGDLCAALKSSKSLASDFVVVVDRINSVAPLSIQDLDVEMESLTIVDAPRIDSEPEWRAGFIRNLGVKHADAQSSVFIFIDADLYIKSVSCIRSWLEDPAGDILVAQDPDFLSFKKSFGGARCPKFQSASSRFLAVKKSSFDQIGGFSEAFNSYGCEDNYFIWSAEKSSARIDFLPDTEIHHLRLRANEDQLESKMKRLSASARLMYRMTLDPDVHAHFFSALGSSVWMRALLRRTLKSKVGLCVWAPVLFTMTLIETDDPAKYTRGLWDVVVWRLKRPLLWIKQHSWRLPHALNLAMMKARAHRYGWSLVGWRLRVLEIRTRGLIKAGAGHVHGFSIRIKFKRRRTFDFLSNALVQCGWILYRCFSVFVGETRRFLSEIRRFLGVIHRFLGLIWRFLGEIWRFLGQLWRLWVIWIQEPVKYCMAWPWHFYRRYHWFLPTYFTLAKNRLRRSFKKGMTRLNRSEKDPR